MKSTFCNIDFLYILKMVPYVSEQFLHKPSVKLDKHTTTVCIKTSTKCACTFQQIPNISSLVLKYLVFDEQFNEQCHHQCFFMLVINSTWDLINMNKKKWPSNRDWMAQLQLHYIPTYIQSGTQVLIGNNHSDNEPWSVLAWPDQAIILMTDPSS